MYIEEIFNLPKMSEELSVSDGGHFIFSEDEILCHRIWLQLICGCYIFVLMYSMSCDTIYRRGKNWDAISQIYSAVMAMLYGGVALVMFHPLIVWIGEHGLHPLEMACSKDLHFSGSLHSLYFMNYIFGFFRLFDMYLVIMRDGSIPTHVIIVDICTMFLTWSDMKFELTVQWVDVLLSTSMTAVTYWHMSLPSIPIERVSKIRHAWIGVLMIEVIARGYALCAKLEFLENGNICHGDIKGMMIGVVISLIYLVIFTRNLSKM